MIHLDTNMAKLQSRHQREKEQMLDSDDKVDPEARGRILGSDDKVDSKERINARF